jgi:hypothetical protein
VVALSCATQAVPHLNPTSPHWHLPIASLALVTRLPGTRLSSPSYLPLAFLVPPLVPTFLATYFLLIVPLCFSFVFSLGVSPLCFSSVFSLGVSPPLFPMSGALSSGGVSSIASTCGSGATSSAVAATLLRCIVEDDEEEEDEVSSGFTVVSGNANPGWWGWQSASSPTLQSGQCTPAHTAVNADNGAHLSAPPRTLSIMGPRWLSYALAVTRRHKRPLHSCISHHAIALLTKPPQAAAVCGETRGFAI